eukprot:TRINITY_DN2320_c0_g1_i1.p1 TRINITY_DN2320_c0_g1~~TRINITY_DN2320_c0_g1_i1.p1  ORF type:complete len:422 (+),score=113.12 TRINITY_DN2320_c0_g1_i1:16-1281(+)
MRSTSIILMWTAESIKKRKRPDFDYDEPKRSRCTPYKCGKCGKPKKGHTCEEVPKAPTPGESYLPSIPNSNITYLTGALVQLQKDLKELVDENSMLKKKLLRYDPTSNYTFIDFSPLDPISLLSSATQNINSTSNINGNINNNNNVSPMRNNSVNGSSVGNISSHHLSPQEVDNPTSSSTPTSSSSATSSSKLNQRFQDEFHSKYPENVNYSSVTPSESEIPENFDHVTAGYSYNNTTSSTPSSSSSSSSSKHFKDFVINSPSSSSSPSHQFPVSFENDNHINSTPTLTPNKPTIRTFTSNNHSNISNNPNRRMHHSDYYDPMQSVEAFSFGNRHRPSSSSSSSSLPSSSSSSSGPSILMPSSASSSSNRINPIMYEKPFPTFYKDDDIYAHSHQHLHHHYAPNHFDKIHHHHHHDGRLMT